MKCCFHESCCLRAHDYLQHGTFKLYLCDTQTYVFMPPKCVKLLFCTPAGALFLPPPHSQRLRSLQIPHSPIPLVSIPPPSLILLLLTPLPRLPPSIPFSRHPSSSHGGQSSSLGRPQPAPSQTKVSFRDFSIL